MMSHITAIESANPTAVLSAAVDEFNLKCLHPSIANKAMLLFIDAWMDEVLRAHPLKQTKCLASARLRKVQRKTLLAWLQNNYGFAPIIGVVQ